MKQFNLTPTILLWFCILSAIGTLMHVELIDLPNYAKQLANHNEIVAHRAPAPYQYRIIQPLLVQSVMNVSQAESNVKTQKIIFLGGYASIRFLSIFIALIVLFFSLRLTWPAETAVFASSALAAFIPFTYRSYFYQPTSVLEMAFFGLGLFATLTRTPQAIVPIVTIGTLNRETMCFIPFAYFIYWLPIIKKRDFVWLSISIGAWILVFMGLRILWPATESLLNISKYISINSSLSKGSFDVILALSPILIVALNVKKIPAHYFRLALCSIPWLALHFFVSIWSEIRYYLPVLIWLLPSLVSSFSCKYDDISLNNFNKNDKLGQI